jgi:2-polyprenyl-3-methyl-5-hydroxy-6-metoxy-1,4-benzoquinol methylase
MEHVRVDAIRGQNFGDDPLAVRTTDHYQQEYVEAFVEKWDELIDWDARAESEGGFFIQVLKAEGKQRILDVSTGTGFHSVQLLRAGFDVTGVDGSAQMLSRMPSGANSFSTPFKPTGAG